MICEKTESNDVMKQTTHTILMIEPVRFGFNDQTAVNNYFQQKDEVSGSEVQRLALAEFNGMVGKLRARGIDVVVVKDTAEPHTPDSIFPNNWISFHRDGRVVLYPMYAENRRAERRSDILHGLAETGFHITQTVDYTAFEKQHRFLEGTGSMVLDHVHKIAYTALSERSDKTLFLHFCADFGFTPVCFSANQTVNGKRLPIYHTNVMMCVADKYAVVCLDTLDRPDERQMVTDSLVTSGKEIIDISEEQMHHFAGNMLQVENKEGTCFLVMSQTAYDSLTCMQTARLVSYNEMIPVAIPTIEKYGGGSARCMMAEVFDERRV